MLKSCNVHLWQFGIVLFIDDSIHDNDARSNNNMDHDLSKQQSCQYGFNLDDVRTDYENINQQQFLLQLTNFIHAAQLNKTTTFSLLSLVK
jgi:hypothetical protein